MKKILIFLSAMLLLISGGVVMAQDGGDGSDKTPIDTQNVSSLTTAFDYTDSENADFFYADISANGTYVALELFTGMQVYEIATGELIYEQPTEIGDEGGTFNGLPVFLNDTLLIYNTVVYDAEFNATIENATIIDVTSGISFGRYEGIVVQHIPALEVMLTVMPEITMDSLDIPAITFVGEVDGQPIASVDVVLEGEGAWYDFDEQFEYPVFAADGSRMALPRVDADGNLYVEIYEGTDFAMEAPLTTIELSTTSIDTVALSPDGSTLAVSLIDPGEDSFDYLLRTYNTETGELQDDITLGSEGRPSQVEYSPSGELLLVTSREVIVALDAETGDPLAEFATPIDGNLEILRFSRDGSTLFGAAYETAVVYTVE
jgi:hypothetical protein